MVSTTKKSWLKTGSGTFPILFFSKSRKLKLDTMEAEIYEQSERGGIRSKDNKEEIYNKEIIGTY